MANKIDTLLSSYELVIAEPWSGTLSTSERFLFLVFDPAELRRVEARLGDFELATKKNRKRWELVSLKPCFPTWMSNHEYRDEYFNDPESLVDQLEAEFKQYAIDYINTEIKKRNPDDQTLIAIKDVSSLFGFGRLSDVLNSLSNEFKGRLLILFPGEYDKNHYRLLDARDGWSYLARPITA
jgi:hypothetical protein